MLIAVFVVVAALYAVATGPPHTSRAHASTCSMVEIPDPHERLALRLVGDSELVLVGLVVDEMRIETQLITSPTGASFQITPHANQFEGDANAVYQSTIEVAAVLKGDLPDGEGRIVLPLLSDTWQCVGSRRLREGNRVLLILSKEATWTSHGVPQDEVWAAGPVGGSIRFVDGEAMLHDFQTDSGSPHLGSAETLIEHVSSRVGASAQARDAAIAALGLSTSREGDTSSTTQTMVAAAVIVTLLGAGLLFAVRSRQTRGRG